MKNQLAQRTRRNFADHVVPVTKWSSKPADHNAVRQRNNQRRHRERVKLHIAQLESRLEETERELQKALATIERLTAKLDRTWGSIPEDDENVEEATSSPSSRPAPRQAGPTGQPRTASQDEGRGESFPETLGGAAAASRDEQPCSNGSCTSPLLPTLPGVSNADSQSGCDAAVRGENKYSCAIKPPTTAESTTRCRDAYRIIVEQNYADVDQATISQWLQPGFRAPITSGDGCRVENKLLFALLDFVSSTRL